MCDPSAIRASIQIRRIESIIHQERPNLTVKFDPNPAPSTVRFLVKAFGDVCIIPASGNLPLDKLESMSDEEIKVMLAVLSNDRF